MSNAVTLTESDYLLLDDTTEDSLELTMKTLDYIKFHEKALAAHKRLAAERTERIQHKIDHHKGNLLTLGLRLKEEYGHATTDVGNGTVTVKKKSGALFIDDEKAAHDWAKNKDVWSNPTPKISSTKVRKALIETAAGDLVDENGEAVAWAKIVGRGNYSVSYKHGESS